MYTIAGKGLNTEGTTTDARYGRLYTITRSLKGLESRTHPTSFKVHRHYTARKTALAQNGPSRTADIGRQNRTDNHGPKIAHTAYCVKEPAKARIQNGP